MSRRIDIELTSRSSDGDWTWRAAGARQPKGALGAAMVPDGAAVGDVLRAVVESGLDGMEIVELLAAKEPERRGPERIEVLGAPRRGPDVSVTYAGGRPRGGPDGPERSRRPPRRNGTGRPGGPPDGAAPRSASARRAGGRPERAEGERPARAREADGERPARQREADGERKAEGPRRPATRRDRRPAVTTVHRNAVLASLRPEQLPIAEQLLRGGIPAVRQAITEQVTAARAAGQPPVATEAILAMAEDLLPQVKLAEWKDRATSAQAAGRDLRLHELRAAVAASRTVTLDDEGRALAKTLREALDQRVSTLRDEWVARISTALDEDRVLDALRISARAPEPGTRCPAELAVRLAAAAGAAMGADQDPHQWQALLDAVLESPVRRTVKPQGIPDDEDLRAAARSAAGLVPELAKLLGLRIPPPPPRRGPVRRPLSPTVGGAPAASS
jgi:hypothetical protein